MPGRGLTFKKRPAPRLSPTAPTFLDLVLQALGAQEPFVQSPDMKPSGRLDAMNRAKEPPEAGIPGVTVHPPRVVTPEMVKVGKIKPKKA